MNKYRNVRTKVDGIWFASAREARRYKDLKLLERAKQISGLTLQPRFPLVVNGLKICTYVADFMYIQHYDSATKSLQHLRTIVEDAKGVRTKDYAIKRKLFQALYPHEHHET